MNNNLLKLSSETINISLSSFVFSIILSSLLSFILSKFYKYQSNVISNPDSLAKVFPILSISTTIIISVIKSSLALSLGLVGALSIVRFRTPIKEPEELAYIFLCIGIGLATGADQYLAACIGLGLTIFFIYLFNRISKSKNNTKTIRLNINGINSSEINNLINIVSRNSLTVFFHNMTISNFEENNSTNISLSIIPENFSDIQKLSNILTDSFPNINLTVIENNEY